MLSLAKHAQQISTNAIAVIRGASKMAAATASLAVSSSSSLSAAAAIAVSTRARGFATGGGDGASVSAAVVSRQGKMPNAGRYGFSAAIGDDRLAGFGATAAPKDALLEQYLSPINATAQEKHKMGISKVRKDFERRAGDTGSSEVQVALLTYKIKYMTEHLKTHRKDFASRKGLEGMLSKRKRLLHYLRRKDGDMYAQVIGQLGLKDKY
eukprot:TRINITY_DN1308_c0_g1_i2.p1 TRINITY_DN1308_c0_g1~~TRINITY_DN1308_c0_g1_i2.p1  ORF type:complete len:210 (+),score=43.17 TRINITY_DN1308_c0_g1_i2:159-788(+)